MAKKKRWASTYRTTNSDLNLKLAPQENLNTEPIAPFFALTVMRRFTLALVVSKTSIYIAPCPNARRAMNEQRVLGENKSQDKMARFRHFLHLDKCLFHQQ